MKICNKCRIEKQDDQFYKKRGQLHHYCKDCLHIYQKIRWNRNKVILINECGGKCMKCGVTGHPSIFDFHHRDKNDKEFTISEFRTRSLTRLKKEIEKCDLLCACCHRLEHLSDECWDFDFNSPKFRKSKQTFDKCVCGKEKSESLKFCSQKCSQEANEVIEWPKNLLELVASSSKRAVAASLGVSDKAVAKRLKNHFKIPLVGVGPIVVPL